MAIASSIVWAEPVGNYFCPLGDGQPLPLRDLPCELPPNWRGGGYFIYVQEAAGSRATFSYTLPTELNDGLDSQRKLQVEPVVALGAQPSKNLPENCVVCECGATISASDRESALRVLAEHKRVEHGVNRQS